MPSYVNLQFWLITSDECPKPDPATVDVHCELKANCMWSTCVQYVVALQDCLWY